MKDDLVILGLISGSSLDGLDMSAVRFAGSPPNIKWEVLATYHEPFPSDLFVQLQQSAYLSSRDLFALEALFSKYCSAQVDKFVSKLKLPIDYLSSHGHTVLHDPNAGYTVQIGNGGIMATLTGISCISDFRINDIARSGQGAPLAPTVEKHLFKDHHCFMNLGGIANISYHHSEGVVAYDICPCNQILNYMARKKGMSYDEGGNMASTGQPIGRLLDEWSAIPYFSAPFPKSMDNTWVAEHFFNDLDDPKIDFHDALRTSTEFIVVQISENIKKLGLQQPEGFNSVMITGGGAHNTFLVKRLREECRTMDIDVHLPKAEWIDYKEGILMALMGYLRVLEYPNTIPSATGASAPSCGGAIYMP